ncbi:tyrosine-type recombinase/integrase [Vallitalea pronyensis]|uniref:Tyrosine-type recombinase/integrase n=1 Tax=Vallitalea pronyensis TaxID=1348613 RepID=A0A8J8SJP7_9FIRM|nr:tyrosine-type recombinase/integrase [Vallitalea pronyensis]QUI25841.1 tyrosine-type recombinase/integrase [Vallitalea pronyensis]
MKDIKHVHDVQEYLKANGENGERNHVLFVLGISTGYRAGDLIQLKVRDVKRALRMGYFEILEGKKRNAYNIREQNIKPREVNIPRKLDQILRTYINNKNSYDYMFKSRKGMEPIQVSQVSRILRDAGLYFGLKNITAHSMRKTYAYRIYVNSDYDIMVVKEMLGHSSIEETKRYIGLDRELYAKYSDTLNDMIVL